MIPNEIKIAGIIYQVEEEKDIEYKYDALGKILYTKGIIILDEELSKERKEQVFIHEVLHGVFFEAGFEEQDEDMINRVAIVLHQVLVDNDCFINEPLTFSF
jgi:hypothetical protein